MIFAKLNIIRKIWKPALLALLMLFTSYTITNLDFSFTSETTPLKWLSSVKNFFNINQATELNAQYCFINVGFDKMLVETMGDDGQFVAGNCDITDRYKLYKFVQLLKKHDNYRYLVLDIDLNKKFKTEFDDSLFTTLSNMKRMAIGIDGDQLLSDYDIRIRNYCFSTNYGSTFLQSDMTKSPLYYKGRPTLTHHVLKELTGDSINQFLCFYHDGYSISRKTLYPTFYIKENSPKAERKIGGLLGYKDLYLNLGSTVLKEKGRYSNFEKFHSLVNNKIVVVGAFNKGTYDRHTTYAGQMSGALILANEIESLLNGNHKISIWVILLYFVIFFFVSYYLLNNEQQSISSGPIRLGWSSKAIKFIVPIALIWTYYWVVLWIAGAIVFIFNGDLYDVYLSSAIFTALDVIIRKYKNK